MSNPDIWSRADWVFVLAVTGMVFAIGFYNTSI